MFLTAFEIGLGLGFGLLVVHGVKSIISGALQLWVQS